jgi:hypothetical protein
MNSEEQFAPIAALDLDPIIVKLMHQESGEGWSREYADAVAFEYRRFLYLVKKFPNEQAAPLFDVDVFWHYHILDTMKYAVDCEAVFGYFLHHFPYVGLRGEEDLKAHHRVGERMRELYERTYGETYIRQGAPTYSPKSDQAAFSIPVSKLAFSVPASKVAFSVPANNIALSVPSGNAAVSVGTAKFAFSATRARPGSLGVAAETDFDAPERAAAAMFYSVRPALSRSA